MRSSTFGGCGLAVLCVASLASVNPAFARIQCDGPYQIIHGDRIATPYCQDGYLAHVAGTYGTRVSADAIRHNPKVKEYVCQFVGADIRVKDICAGLIREEERSP